MCMLLIIYLYRIYILGKKYDRTGSSMKMCTVWFPPVWIPKCVSLLSSTKSRNSADNWSNMRTLLKVRFFSMSCGCPHMLRLWRRHDGWNETAQGKRSVFCCLGPAKNCTGSNKMVTDDNIGLEHDIDLFPVGRSLHPCNGCSPPRKRLTHNSCLR